MRRPVSPIAASARPLRLAAAGAAALALGLAACSGGSAPAGPPPALAPAALPALPTPMPTSSGLRSKAAAPNPIKHIVIIIQENRTFDNLFHGYASPVDGPADYASSGQAKMADGSVTTMPLVQVPFEEVYDPGHGYHNFVPEYDNGAMDGFYLQNQGTAPPASEANYGYAYLPQLEVQPYWDMASEGALAQRAFHGFTGPTYPSHLVFVSGTTNGIDSNPTVQLGWGCFDQNPSDLAPRLVPGPTGSSPTNGVEIPGEFPCFDNLTIADLLTRAGHTWHYYSGEPGMSPGGNLNGLASYRQDYYGSEFSKDSIFPETRILADVGTTAAPGTLADVTYVVPEGENSDHAQGGVATGPQWVGSVVNAIGESSFYPSTAIFVSWDDWGGWYDHVVPPARSIYGPGFRIPIILVSPYAKHGRLIDDELEPGSILKFAEETFDLPTLGQTDLAAKNSASVMFDFTQSPAPFVPIAIPPSVATAVPGSGNLPIPLARGGNVYDKAYFMHRMRHTMQPVDND